MVMILMMTIDDDINCGVNICIFSFEIDEQFGGRIDGTHEQYGQFGCLQRKRIETDAISFGTATKATGFIYSSSG